MPGFAALLDQFKSFVRGYRLIDGGELAALVQQVASGQGSITAFQAGGAAGATLLTAAYNNVTTVGAAAASVLLPPAIAGTSVVVVNSGANSLTVYPTQFNQYTSAADQIIPNNSSAPGASFALAVNGAAEFFCVSPGLWKATLSA